MESDLSLQKRGLSGAALKTIALVSMLIDHAAVVLLVTWAQQHGPEGLWRGAKTCYLLMRGIGRLAFPIYCFLLVEGFTHTRSRVKYLLRLLAFALLSEIPFDLAGYKTLCTWEHQNVFFTLAFGLMAMMAWERLAGEEGDGRWTSRKLLAAMAAGACCLLARLCHTDYGFYGTALILVMYLLRQQEALRDIVSAGVLYAIKLNELIACFDFLLFRLYDGSRGRYPKYLFYVFYPAHLLLLALLRRLVFSA